MQRCLLGAVLALTIAAGLTGCLSAPPRTNPASSLPPPSTTPPPLPDSVPNAMPRIEPRARNGNPPFYDVFGKRYFVLSSGVGYVERGVASWYGPGFHKVRTSTGELYDMYGMTAAHKTLPLPAYVQVTNLQNGRSIVVRVNGPRPLRRQPHHRPVVYRRRQARHVAQRHGDRRSAQHRSPRRWGRSPHPRPPPAALLPGTAAGASTAADGAPAGVPSGVSAHAAGATGAAGVVGVAGVVTGNSTAGASGAPSSASGASAPTAAVPGAGNPSNLSAAASAAAGVVTTSPVNSASLFIQAGAFSDPANAERLADKLRAGSYGKVFVRDDRIAGRRMYRVRIGPVPDVAHFDRIVAALEHIGINDAHLALD